MYYNAAAMAAPPSIRSVINFCNTKIKPSRTAGSNLSTMKVLILAIISSCCATAAAVAAAVAVATAAVVVGSPDVAVTTAVAKNVRAFVTTVTNEIITLARVTATAVTCWTTATKSVWERSACNSVIVSPVIPSNTARGIPTTNAKINCNVSTTARACSNGVVVPVVDAVISVCFGVVNGSNKS